MKREDSPEPLSSDARLLLRGGRPPRARSAGERARTEKRIVKLGAMPVVASAAWLVWAKGAALAAGLTLAAGTVVAIKTRYAKPDAPASPSASPRGRRSGVRAARAREPAPVASAAPAVVVPEVAPSVVFVQPSAQPSAPVVVQVRRPALSASRPSTPSAAPSVAPLAAPAPALDPQPSAPLAPPVVVEAAPTVRAPDLGEETTFGREVHDLLATAPQRAIEMIDQRNRIYGRDRTLYEEHEVVAVLSLLRLGRTEEARTRGAALIARSPRSVSSARVRRSLADAGVSP